MELKEIDVSFQLGPVPVSISELHCEGIRRSKNADCFGYVPSNTCLLFSILKMLEPGTFCEWGSGIGIGVAVAESLRFSATGIELDEKLSAESRLFLSERGFQSKVITGSYFEIQCEADTYLTYCWPSQMREMEEHFLTNTPDDARLIYAYGADDLRCVIKA